MVGIHDVQSLFLERIANGQRKFNEIAPWPWVRAQGAEEAAVKTLEGASAFGAETFLIHGGRHS